MAVALDRRTRLDVDLRLVTPDEFFSETVPDLLARHGRMVAEGVDALDAPPLALEVGDRSWSFVVEDSTVVVREGVADGALVVTLD
jgi:hypothetical protein